jgi:hypothetical protein
MTDLLNKEATTHSVPVTPDMIAIDYHRRPDGRYTTNTLVTRSGPELFILRTDSRVLISKHSSRTTRTPLNVTYPFGKSRRKDNIKRARTRVRRLILTNWPTAPSHSFQNPCFVTLTYPDTPYAKIENRQKHIQDVQQFHRKLRARFRTPHLRYLAVPELTKKKNVHWHILVFGLPKFSHPYSVLDLWLQVVPDATINNQDIKRVPWGDRNAKQQARNMAGYLSKYLAKTFEDNNLTSDKMYLPSKGLEQPETFTNPKDVALVLEQAIGKLYKQTKVSGTFFLPFFGVDAHYEIWET